MAYYQIFIFLCVFLLFTIAESPPQARLPSPPPHSFIFALQWPRSFCNTAQRIHDPCIFPIPSSHGFKIHGLWPQDSSGNPMENCQPSASLNKAAVNKYSFIADLQNYWPNLMGQDFTFWKHEWDKHGTCSGQTPEDYFLKAIDLIKFIDNEMQTTILNCFSTEKLPPGAVYAPSKFPSAILKFAHLVANITCNFDFAGRNQLHEIRFCTDGNGVLRNCPHLMNWRNSVIYNMRGCNTQGILFPA
ncbi:hypothetical protein LguiA_018448 [Lonicera macranthoides]